VVSPGYAGFADKLGEAMKRAYHEPAAVPGIPPNMQIASNFNSGRLLFIPIYAFFKRDSRTPKYIQRTPNSKVDLAVAQLLDMVQILQIPSTASICYRDTAPLRQPLHQFLIYTLLEAFIIGRMY
jgi:hypothetical protein